MKRIATSLIALLVLLVGSVARGEITGLTDPHVVFANRINLSELRSLSLQDRLTVKTWDTFARQAIASITGRSTLDDREPLYTLLDIAFRGDQYADRNLIKVKNAQLRIDFKTMPGLDPAEAERIRSQGLISLKFWRRADTQAFVERLQQDAVWKSQAIGEVEAGAALLERLTAADAAILPVMAFIPPPPSEATWHTLGEVSGNVPALADMMRANGQTPQRIEGYDDAKMQSTLTAVGLLGKAWKDGDVAAAQAQIDSLARTLPTMSSAYPSATKRHAEVLYNKLYKLTLPGAALYFVAFVCFVVAAYSTGPNIRRAGVAFMVLGWLLHTTGIGMRWWLDQSSTASWFYSIPIKNQFESVMMSAWFGIMVGLLLEIWKKKSLFGAAACFVGWFSLIALFTVPYVIGIDIGNDTNRAQGILMSYWLYVHVTLVTASYSLIGMTFLLGIWWLVRYVTAPPEVHAMSANRLSADADMDAVEGASRQTLVGAGPGHLSDTVTPISGFSAAPTVAHINKVQSLLARLDAANLVILQLAFWMLGVGIVCGAVWADVSWGRPWGWDAKETFALVTWIVYMIIIHVRLVTRRKAFWTAVLAIVGFGVMLFNWIGVNYFLVGLHSYA